MTNFSSFVIFANKTNRQTSNNSSFSKPCVALPTSQLILQSFRCFTYVTAHSATLPSFHLRQNSFSDPSVALPTSQLILQPFRRFIYVTTHSPTLPPLYLRHSSFSNPSVALPTSQLISNPFFASPTSQALHLSHLASRPYHVCLISWSILIHLNRISQSDCKFPNEIIFC